MVEPSLTLAPAAAGAFFSAERPLCQARVSNIDLTKSPFRDTRGVASRSMESQLVVPGVVVANRSGDHSQIA